jgi:hypothetical protein
VVEHGRRGSPRLDLLQIRIQGVDNFSKLVIKVTLDGVKVLAFELGVHLFLFLLFLVSFLVFLGLFCEITRLQEEYSLLTAY